MIVDCSAMPQNDFILKTNIYIVARHKHLILGQEAWDKYLDC